LMQKFACSPIRERRRRGVVVRSIVPGKGVTLTRIAVDRRVGFAGQRRFDLGLRELRNELVLLGQMHEQRSMEAVDLAEILLGVAAVISDRGVAAVRNVSSAPRQKPRTATLPEHSSSLATASAVFLTSLAPASLSYA
jgi:hypothetical protein